jgi:hypothetical protein
VETAPDGKWTVRMPRPRVPPPLCDPSLYVSCLDSRPRNEAEENKRNQNNKKRLSFKLKSQPSDTTSNACQAKPQAKQVTCLPKRRPQEGNDAAPAIVAPPKNRRKVFTWKKKTKHEASQQTPPRRTTIPEDAAVIDTDTKSGELSPDASSNADPTTRRWTAKPVAIIRGARGEHLGPPQPH